MKGSSTPKECGNRNENKQNHQSMSSTTTIPKTEEDHGRTPQLPTGQPKADNTMQHLPPKKYINTHKVDK